MFNKVLIANRGAIAVRIIRTLKSLSVGSVVVYSEEDRDSLHVQLADEAHCLGSGPAKQTYLDQDKLFAVAKQSGAEAIHPGYGFLSENPDFVERCEREGVVFIGPTAQQMRVFGLKHTARELAEQSQVPLLPGTDLLESREQSLVEADRIGYPVMIKSTAGGGGIGMQVCHSAEELSDAYDSVKRLSENNFANAGVFLEKFIEHARHIEVQIIGDGYGTVVALGERDCSSQRRNQKVIEEAPAANLNEQIRKDLIATAVRLGESVQYRNAGTVEFVVDAKTQAFYFLEVNTRLQVEHGVTEEVFGVDLVQWMLQVAAGEMPDLQAARNSLKPAGHAIQVRIYAEDPAKNFQPCAGLLSEVIWPEQPTCRIDSWVESGTNVAPFYDPMIAKVIVKAEERDSAIANLSAVLANTSLYGIETNLAYLQTLLQLPIFCSGEMFTRYLNDHNYSAATLDVISGGTMTTVQDYPGRCGYWDVGVPPSGPFDSLSFRLGNRLLGNDENAAGLEITLNGPTLVFNQATAIVLCGADMQASLDGEAVPFWQVVAIEPGQRLQIGKVQQQGARSYLLVQGGIQCPEYLGSRSTFTLGQFGGHAGRVLQAGDVLHLKDSSSLSSGETQLAAASIPSITTTSLWQLRVIYGPHGAPDFFTDEDIETLFATEWEVHYNSSRTGIRLIGPKPQWARSDGGEAGMHPSNIHDNAYAVGTVDFTGDMPVILGPDGPSLGGFVCPATVIQADLWKLGQLKAGDKLRFVPVSMEDAVQTWQSQQQSIVNLEPSETTLPVASVTTPVLKSLSRESNGVEVCYRPSGDDFLLIEYGPLVLDIELRFRVHALMLWLQDNPLAGMAELTPGIRSLQVHYNPLQLSLADLLEHLERAESELGDCADMTVPTRIVRLPISWNDSACQLAVEKYMQSVRADAPWCPDNIEFIRRINGLDSVEAVKQIVFDASWLVMGLGDVYLGAPVATPLDPRHRLVTTKYNPARTWTAENSVGIGGSYLCVYGMEGPGGYQFIGRTLQMWNRFRTTKDFSRPWLLRFFDQIQFYEVDAEELLQIREDFPLGNYSLQTESSEFSLQAYQQFLSENHAEISTFTEKREQAFAEELQRWIDSGQINFESESVALDAEIEEAELADNEMAVESPVAGNVWKVLVAEGDFVTEGTPLMILESMKMEIEVFAPAAGVVGELIKHEGAALNAGERVAILNMADS